MDEGGHEPGGASAVCHDHFCERCQRCDHSDHRRREHLMWRGEHLKWFEQQWERNLDEVRCRRGEDVDRPDHLARDQLVADAMSPEASRKHYLQLLQQQREVLASKADGDAFRHGLQRFPSLERVTITPFAHGELFSPLYETPMIRAFPRGFNYPLPRTWLINRQELLDMGLAHPWSDLSEADKDRWRGFRIVARELAHNQHHRVTELAIDNCHLLSGINCTIFAEPCAEYDNLVALLLRPGFRRLDLALLTGEQSCRGWSAFRSGHLRRALSEAPGMEHISLRSSESRPDEYRHLNNPPDYRFVPLRTIFPVETWPRLHHFELSQFPVRQNDLLSFLGTLPATLRPVELTCLLFQEGNYYDLLEGMRTTLTWRGRIEAERPKVTVGTMEYVDMGRMVWVDKAVDSFLYGDGANPFHEGEKNRNVLKDGVGIERDPL